MEVNKRWIERCSYYHTICGRLASLTGSKKENEFNFYSEAALVKIFELTYGLSLQTLQNYLRFTGCDEAKTESDIIAQALDNGIISNRGLWHDMQRDSNHMHYIYNIGEMHEIAKRIYNSYVFALTELDNEFQERAKDINA